MDIDFEYTHRDDVVHHLEEYYGLECVSHIGTYSQLGVKNGIKDVCRVLEVPYAESNRLTSMIDELNDSPNLKFKDLDAMKEGTADEQKAWKDFHDLEERYPEVFRLARAFEGTPRNQGVHASGILVTPMPVTDMFPVRYKDGTAIALWTGPQLEHFGAVKYDILGLKTLSVIQKALNFIPELNTIQDLYDAADIQDENVWKYICSKQTEGVFQIESNMMKGIIDIIKPNSFEDLIAINSLGRPGPLAAGMPQDYGERKNGAQAISYPIHGCDDLMKDTYGTIPYQEILMGISKRIAGFNDMQADSLTRKTIAKKKQSMMPMLIRCHIWGKVNHEGPAGWDQPEHANDHEPWYDPKAKYGDEIPGAIANGYTAEEVLSYFKTIKKFSSYCFNKSHAACYAYIGILTAWLKYYYPEQFMAAVLTMTADEKKPMYIEICKKMGLTITAPNINISKRDFTPDPKHHQILYGIGSVKSIGEVSINPIIDNAPYADLEDAKKRLPKKAFNKKVAENLIKAGAFDWQDSNRINLLNLLHEIRGDKAKNEATGKREIIVEDSSAWNENTCMAYEMETLGTHITYHTWWENLNTDEMATFTGEIVSVREHTQKNGGIMAFVTMHDPDIDEDIECCVFAKQYGPLNSLFYGRVGHMVKVNGRKSDTGSFIINDAQPVKEVA